MGKPSVYDEQMEEGSYRPPEDSEDKTEEIEMEALAAKENRWVFGLRFLTAFLLVGVAISVCLVVYLQACNAEQADFEQDFSDLAEKLVTSFAENFRGRFGGVQNFATDLTNEAAGGSSGDWPFFTPRDWEIRATGVGRNAHLMMLILSPYVELSEREAWDEYANANQGWKAEGLAHRLKIPLEEVNAKPIFSTLTNAHYGGPPKPYEGPGPLWPLWNSWPAAYSTVGWCRIASGRFNCHCNSTAISKSLSNQGS